MTSRWNNSTSFDLEEWKKYWRALDILVVVITNRREIGIPCVAE